MNKARVRRANRKGLKIMAKYLFPAVFVKEDNGQYSVSFPDIPQCYTCGDDLQDAFDMAQDVLCLRLYDMEEAGEAIPRASAVQSIHCGEKDTISLVGCDTIEYRRLNDNTAVKKTLTIPSWLNTMAEREGVNFSAVLQNALRNELHL